MINLILAIDNNYGIGYKNELLYYFPKDLKRFVDKTKNKTVVMGRKTWQSLPKKLPNRNNYVISNLSNLNPMPDLITNIETILSLNDDIWIIGGASIYKEFIEHTQIIELTKINGNTIYDTDVKWLENHLKEFEIISIEITKDVNKIDNKEYELQFITYKRK